MARASGVSFRDLCEEALCSICLEYFKDPVILIECGHNFCRACVTRYWEGSEGGEVSCCPQCRRKVQRNPIPNRQLGNFVDLTRKLRLAEGQGAVCGEHQEPLKLFCKDDDIPICVVCKWLKQHQDHQVVPLEEVLRVYKDQICHRLEVQREEILAYKAATEGESQELLKETKEEMEKAKEQFRELRSFLNEQEKLLMAQMEEVEKEIARNRDEHLARLSEELSSLGGLIQEMEQMHQLCPEEFLQEIKSILQRDNEKKTSHNPSELKSKIQDVRDRNTFLAQRMKQFRDTLVVRPQTLPRAKVQVNFKNSRLKKVFTSERNKSRDGKGKRTIPRAAFLFEQAREALDGPDGRGGEGDCEEQG